MFINLYVKNFEWNAFFNYNKAKLFDRLFKKDVRETARGIISTQYSVSKTLI